MPPAARQATTGTPRATPREHANHPPPRKRAPVAATSLRARPVTEKAAICCGVVENVWPLVAAGAIRPIVETTMPLEDVARAHQLMEDGSHSGKILLTL